MPENHTPHIIYLDADSEITEAIDKLKAANGHEVRVAVPARSTMLQSAVNIKLLKKTATTHHKELVLVSNDKATISLAAGLGVLVAKNVKAEAMVPELAHGAVAAAAASEPVIIEQELEEPKAKKPKKGDKSSDSFQKQHISLDENEENVEASGTQHDATNNKSKKEKRVPNFGGLNKKIFFIVAAVGVLLLLILGYIFLPTAKTTLVAKAQKTPINLKFTLDAGTKRSNFSEGVVAADTVSSTKELTTQFSATGQKDIGQKATGNVSVKNCEDTNPHSMPSGTKLTSGGKTFVANSAVAIPAGTFSGGGTVCTSSTVSVAITADQNGDSYNMSNATFAISGQPSKITATGSTSGGVSRVATVVSQSDIDKAKKSLTDQATTTAKSELQNKAGDDQRVFEQTLNVEVTTVTSSVPVDSEASTATLTAQAKFSELSANNNDLDELFKTQIESKIPGGNQIYQSGASDAQYSLVKSFGADKADMSASSNAYYGQAIDKNQVARDLAGKSKKDAADILKPTYPQITQVLVETNPWLAPNLPFFANRNHVEIRVQTD